MSINTKKSTIKDKLAILQNKIEKSKEIISSKANNNANPYQLTNLTPENRVKELLNNQTETVKINISGKKFEILRSTLNNLSDNLITLIINDPRYIPDMELFFDRNPENFHYIEKYIRNPIIDYKKINSTKNDILSIILKECEFFEFNEYAESIRSRQEGVKIINYKVSELFLDNEDKPLADADVSEISIKNVKIGVCAGDKNDRYKESWILFELNWYWNISSIEIAPINNIGKKIHNWKNEFGEKSDVYFSSNQLIWTKVCTLTNFNKLNTYNASERHVKYIKIVSKGPLGIGYLKLNDIK